MKGIFWNIVERDGAVSLLLYGDVGSGCRVDGGCVVAELAELSARYGRIEVHINSRGGEVFEGMAIYNALRTSPADITVYVDGLAASIAGVIALCGKPLYMSRYARLMILRVSGWASGNADEMRRAADLAESLENDLSAMIADRCGMEPDEVKAAYFDGGEYWFTAQQAVDAGMANGIVDTEGGMPPGDRPTDEEIYNFTNRLMEPINDRDMALLEELKKRPSFADMATEEQVLQHIGSLENQAAKVPDLENRVRELNERVNENERKSREAFLSQAVSEGRITQDVVPYFMSLMEADEKSVREAVGAMPKRGTARVEDYLNTAGPASGTPLAEMSWDEIDRAERLAELKNSHPDLYRKKFNEKFGK